jgi:hypothetical protein
VGQKAHLRENRDRLEPGGRTKPVSHRDPDHPAFTVLHPVGHPDQWPADPPGLRRSRTALNGLQWVPAVRALTLRRRIEPIDILAENRGPIASGCAERFALHVEHDERSAPGEAVRYDDGRGLAGAGAGVECCVLTALKVQIVAALLADENRVLLHQNGFLFLEMPLVFMSWRVAHVVLP